MAKVANNQPPRCLPCGAKGLCGGRGLLTLKDGAWTTNPLAIQVLATFVILFDQFLKAFYWDMSKQLGPYVGLIITNCIIMGRAEAFALQNPPILSIVDGAANGLGYAAVLAIIGFFRELSGTGEVLGYPVLNSTWYTPNQLMILAPGAFFALGIVIAIYKVFRGPDSEENKR